MSEKLRARRHRITIEKRIEFRDCVGGVHYRWEPMSTTWAERRGNLITIRRGPEVKAGMRIIFNNEAFDITHVLACRQAGVDLLELTIEKPGHERECLMRDGDEQRGFRAFPRSW